MSKKDLIFKEAYIFGMYNAKYKKNCRDFLTFVNLLYLG